MQVRRLPTRDPRSVARDIPGVLDILFPRLKGSLVNKLNEKLYCFPGIVPIPSAALDKSQLQKALIFEISVARAESGLRGGAIATWDECLVIASNRQRRHFDARIPDKLETGDILVADHAASPDYS
jgi:hypothetical protein